MKQNNMIIKSRSQQPLNERANISVGILASTTATIAAYKTYLALSKNSLVGKNSVAMDVSNIFNNVVSTTYSLYRYYFGNPHKIKPAAVLAGIPLATVEEISHAVSDRILKFRATGGIFLAHQEGGETTLRIKGKAVGPGRYAFLTIMDMLFFYGNSRNIDLFTNAPAENLIAEVSQLDRTTSPWKQFDRTAIDQGKEEKHLTFPVITRSKVYTNMYIETWEFSESVEFGMDVINFTIFLRKYVPHFPYTYQRTWNEKGDKYITYYKEDEDSEAIKILRFLDTVADLGLSTAMYMYRFFQFAAGNSTETTTAHITGLELNKNIYSEDNTTYRLQQLYDIDYDLKEFSIPQKEELMAVD